MRKIFSFAIISLAALCLGNNNALAQTTESPVNLEKYVTGPDANGKYTITLEAYAKGSSITTVTEEVKPNDIVIVLDYSNSMRYNNVNVISRTKVSAGTVLTVGTNYLIKKDGKEYYLKGFTHDEETGAYTYTARTSQKYTYQGYSNSYYYKYGDNYYLVSRGSNNSRYYLSFVAGGTTYYLSGTGITTTRTTVKKNTDTIWTGVLYTRSAATQTKYYYRYGTTLPSAYTSGTEFYTGTTNYTVQATDEIYTYKTETKTRLEVATQAAADFIETVYKNTPTKVEGKDQEYHKLAVVGFNKNTFEVVEFDDVTKDTKTGMQTKVKNQGTNGDTVPGPAMGKAYDILHAEGVVNDGRKKVVVFFTDGLPEDFGDCANLAVNNSYNLKKAIKDGGCEATVYSVACLGSSDMNNQQMLNFLHFVSSNYPDKHGDTINYKELSGTASAPRDYMQVSDGSDLAAIFDKIAEESSKGGASVKLNAETTTVIDVLSADFVLPEGTDINNIGLFVDYVTGYNEEKKEYTFAREGNLVPEGEQRSKYVSFADVTEGGSTTKKISVTGFDFTKEDTPSNGEILYGNWVGPRKTTVGGKETTVYKGKRLVITIPIVPTSDYAGGYNLPTNKGNSGVYTVNEQGETVAVDNFPIPTLDFPSIGIIKKGLAVGESATFTVQRSGDAVEGMSTKFNVILTNTGSGVPYAILKDIPEGTYTITETDWSWTYGVDQVGVYNKTQNTFVYENKSATIQVLSKGMVTPWSDHGIEETTQCVLVVFTNSKETTPAINPDGYAEAVANNKFRKAGASSGNSSTTINSKSQPHAQE